MIISLEESKRFMRMDYDEEDEFVELCINNAEEYLRDCIDNFDTKLSIDRFVTKAKMLMLCLVQDMFDNRDMVYTTGEQKLRFTTQSLLTQMQYITYNEVVE